MIKLCDVLIVINCQHIAMQYAQLFALVLEGTRIMSTFWPAVSKSI